MATKKKKPPHGNAKYAEWLEPDGLTKLEGWARLGLTNDQIARNMGINTCTLYEYRKRFPEIANAIKKAKEVVDFEVENALLKRALGYDYYEEEESVQTKNGVTTKRAKKTKKHMPGDVTAQIYWLNNRNPDVWRKLTSAQAAEAAARLKKTELETDKIQEEAELLKAQRERLRDGTNTKLDEILSELVLAALDEDEEELETEAQQEGDADGTAAE